MISKFFIYLSQGRGERKEGVPFPALFLGGRERRGRKERKSEIPAPAAKNRYLGGERKKREEKKWGRKEKRRQTYFLYVYVQ